MSIIETLTEGIVNRDMKKEGSALLNKWELKCMQAIYRCIS